MAGTMVPTQVKKKKKGGKMLFCCFRVESTEKSNNGKINPKADKDEEWEGKEDQPYVGRPAGIRLAFLGSCCVTGKTTISRGITMIKSFGRGESKISRPPSGKDMPPPQPRPREIRY